MAAQALDRSLGTRIHDLPDGRSVTVRRAVPSDAPRLVHLGGSAYAARRCELVALDPRGTVVGHAVAPAKVMVAGAWARSGLGDLLAQELEGV